MTAADITAWLDEAQQRADAATEGPTLDRYDHGGGRLAAYEPERVLVADFYNEADREFYTAARTDLPRALAALRAVVGMCDPSSRKVWGSNLDEEYGVIRVSDLRDAISDALGVAS